MKKKSLTCIETTFHEINNDYAFNFTPFTDRTTIDEKEFPCLSKDEVAFFNLANRDGSVRMHKPAGSPCTDCDAEYREEMTVKNLCRRPGMTITIDRDGRSSIYLGAPVVLVTDFEEDDEF